MYADEAKNEEDDSGIQLDLLEQGLEYEEGSPPFYFSTPIMNSTATNDNDVDRFLADLWRFLDHWMTILYTTAFVCKLLLAAAQID